MSDAPSYMPATLTVYVSSFPPLSLSVTLTPLSPVLSLKYNVSVPESLEGSAFQEYHPLFVPPL